MGAAFDAPLPGEPLSYAVLSHALAAFGGFAVAALVGALWRIGRRRFARRPLSFRWPVAAAQKAPEPTPSARTRHMVHELNNILTAVGGFAELARQRPIEDADAAACLDQVVLGVQRASLVTGRLLGPLRPAPAPVVPEGVLCTGTVLVVDDDEPVRDVAALALLEHGFAVHRAAGGAEALALIDAMPGDIDLVLTDVMMPDMTGPELARHLARHHPTVAVVYMSGYENRRPAKERMIGRDEACLAKPFAPEHLAAEVGAALARHRSNADRQVA
ncbi:MAG TPA: response regulator [Alphaproteobacteria bacterium]|nr:response regulator [Alphaproteobacteria bacterium]